MTNDSRLDRRVFLKRCSTAVAVAGAAGHSLACAQDSSPSTIKKAVKYSMVKSDGSVRERFQLVKDLGFDGIEVNSPSGTDRAVFKQASESVGLPIHGVIDSVHWRQTLSHPDPEVRQQGLDGLLTAIRDADFYGATTVLLVPAVVNKEVSYDAAYQRSQQEIRKALPLAAELDVTIALENVWNQFLLSPLETARYIDEFESQHVAAYFDVGNIVNYGWPEQWIRILGRRIVKLDIKEFSRRRRDEEGLRKGFQVKLGEGDCDWPAVMAAVREIGYEGWGTAEVAGGGRERLAEIARRMDVCFAS